MTIAFRTADSLAAHAVCAAAGARDGLRTAQFYAREVSKADAGPPAGQRNITFLSSAVARVARLTDRLISWGADTSIYILLPGWRRLPSPFTPGILSEVADAIRKNSLIHNPLFNAYFFRAAARIVGHYTEPPFLVLEHRVDASRRELAIMGSAGSSSSETEFLARALLALVETAPVARVGRYRSSLRLFEEIDPNIAVFAIACVTLLFAKEGKPIPNLDEDAFFAIVGALILPRLKAISDLIARRDIAGLSRELADIKAMY